MRRSCSLLATLWLFACGGAPADRSPAPEPTPVATEATSEVEPPAPQKLEISGYQEMLDLFEKLGYTPEAWQAGIREVPRVYLTEIPERWGKETAQEITVLLKKRLFFRTLAPLVLHSNELILSDRQRLAGLRQRGGESWTPEERAWLATLAARYDVVESSEAALAPGQVDDLWERVDIIPVSLALSQAAEESGWGTSRFAAHGNALFGQWTWGSHGMKPNQARQARGDYGVAAFETPLQSVMAYMLNLNSHDAYQDLRDRRAAARRSGEEPTGADLALGLSRYSERGEQYVRSLHSLMQVNRLAPADQAYLAKGPPTFLVPPGASPP